MSTEAGRAELVRQLAAQGWAGTAIAAATGMSVERVALALGRGGVAQPAPAEPDTATTPASLRSAAQQPLRTRVTRPMAAEDFGRATFERLAKQRAEQHAKAQALRAEIERLALADRASGNRKRGRAKRIQGQLARPVALRTVQWHLATITQKGSPARE